MKIAGMNPSIFSGKGGRDPARSMRVRRRHNHRI